MGKTFLFSPIGNTDPIKYFRDGSMLHICRHYKPDVVYLYLSKEMVSLHNKDNRFQRTLDLLGQKLKHKFEVHVICREELVNVQNYDFFYQEFNEEIKRIKKSMNREDELLLNMASGTPAMKRALLVIATLAEYRFRAIQVSSPKKKSNLEYEDREDYDVQTIWELDEDNAAGSENRCKEVQCMNLIQLLKRDMIKKHVEAYDYYAALDIADDMEDGISENALALLKIASERVKLNKYKVSEILKKYPYDIYPVKEDQKQRVFEYALGIQLKLQKKEYADFLRAVTPISLDLLVNVMERYCGINLNAYIFTDNNKQLKWSKGKLKGTETLEILEEKYYPFRYGNIYSSHICAIIQKKCQEDKLKTKVAELVDVEQKVRNTAAHEIVSVTDEWIFKKTGKHPEEIMSIIHYLCGRAGIVGSKDAWNSYDNMNKLIIQALDE